MLYILFSLILILPVIAGFGTIWEKLFGNFFEGISSKLLSGIFLISIFWLITAFFFPLNIVVETISLLIGLSSFFYFKIYNEFWNFFNRQKFSFLIIFFTTLFFGSFFPFILDHFGYYVPTVKWLSEVGLVKGISNLDLLLGQMSVWHLFQAGFSNFSDPFLRINSIILIVYLIYIFEKKSWIQLLFLPFLFLFSQSPSPDLPVIAFSLIVLNEILFGNKNTSQLFAISVFVFTTKPTMIWLPIFTFLYGVFILKSKLKFIILGSLILILYFAKNLYCFGFPIFPSQFGDIGISWKPNPELLKISSKTAIEKTFDMQYQYSEIQKFTIIEHLKNWLLLKGIKSKIHLLFILSLAFFTVFSVLKKKKIISLICISILIKCTLVLLFSAQYRFFIDVFFVIVFVVFYQNISKKTSLILFSVLSIFFAGFLSFPNWVKIYIPSFKLGQFMMGFQKTQFYEPSYFALNQYKTHQIGNLKFNVADGYPFSFDIPIPAISPEFLQEDYDAGIFPQQNSENLKEGFYWRKLTDDEKIQLKNILIEINQNF